METKIYITMGANIEEDRPIILGIFKSLESAKNCEKNMKDADRFYKKKGWYYWIQTDYLFD